MLRQVSASVSGHAYCCQQKSVKDNYHPNEGGWFLSHLSATAEYEVQTSLVSPSPEKEKKKCPFDRHIKSSSITRVAAGQGWGGYLPSPTIDLPPSDLNLDISSPFRGVIFSLLYFHSPWTFSLALMLGLVVKLLCFTNFHCVISSISPCKANTVCCRLLDGNH